MNRINAKLTHSRFSFCRHFNCLSNVTMLHVLYAWIMRYSIREARAQGRPPGTPEKDQSPSVCLCALAFVCFVEHYTHLKNPLLPSFGVWYRQSCRRRPLCLGAKSAPHSPHCRAPEQTRSLKPLCTPRSSVCVAVAVAVCVCV